MSVLALRMHHTLANGASVESAPQGVIWATRTSHILMMAPRSKGPTKSRAREDRTLGGRGGASDMTCWGGQGYRTVRNGGGLIYSGWISLRESNAGQVSIRSPMRALFHLVQNERARRRRPK